MKPKTIMIRVAWLQDPKLQKVFRMISQAGGEARIAGGAVRSALLGEPMGDIDLATNLKPKAVIKAAAAKGLKVIQTGLAHGTVTVVVGSTPYEITTLRRDVATDGRHAEVEFTDDWAADAQRRDLTINSMMLSQNGELYDYTNGYKDILRKRIRFVGEPKQRIREDYLRLLRFFRFAAKYGLSWADKKSLDACALLRGGLKTLSTERIATEMRKLLEGRDAVPVLKTMAKRQVLKQILPYKDDFRLVERLPADATLRLFALSSDPSGLQEQLKLSNADAERIDALQSAPAITPALRPAEQRHMLYALGDEAWQDAIWLSWARSKEPKLSAPWKRLLTLPSRWPKPQMPVSGRDLIAAGMKPGPALGEELQRLEDFWISTDFKAGKEQLLKYQGDKNG